MQSAIYYNDMYYLLPEEYCDHNMFFKDLRDKNFPAQFQMVALYENHNARNFTVIKGQSMAPYFLSGYHDEPIPITISNPEDVYPVEVEVMDQSEYNAKLREVINRVCPGCLRFKPLSNRVQSLNGHFEEMTLDGVCLFRQESKPAPRIFHEHLFSFGGFFKHFDYAKNSAKEMHDHIKQWFYVRYADAVLLEENNCKTLTLQCKKNELLAPLLTTAISSYLDEISNGTYHIRLSENYIFTESTFKELVNESNAEAFRKDCKKYGISLAVLEYDDNATEKVRHSLKPLFEHFWIFPLLQTNGKEYYLVSDTSMFLKELRFRSPLLQAYHTDVSIFDQFKNTQYQVSFDMKQSQV